MPKLLLLDGNSLLYRGFFAMRSLTTASGQPTNAIYSLAMMLLLAIDREKPDGVVCAWDTPEPTFRHTDFAAYKAQRAAPPEELTAQRGLSRELISCFNIMTIEAPGWEADDIIGSIAQREKLAGNEVLIVTGDLDSVQLVDDGHGPVRVMSTLRGVTDTLVYDEAAVQKRYGLAPRQIPDYKALKGDPSDNIPGVPGIGDKTATLLLSEFDTIENLLQHVDDVKSPKLQDLLRRFDTEARQYKRLATIACDVKLPKDFVIRYDYRSTGPDSDRARDLFERLDFRTLIRRLPTAKGEPARVEPPAVVAHAKAPSAQGALDFDSPAPTDDAEATGAQTINETEWSGALGVVIGTSPLPANADLMNAKLISLTISGPDGLRSLKPEQVGDVRGLLEDEGIPKIIHDVKLSIGILHRHGITLRGVRFDTMLAAYLLNAGRGSYRLNALAKDLLFTEPAEDDWPALAQVLRRIEPIQRKRLRADGLEDLHDSMELPLAGILAAIELHGVSIDADWMHRIGSRLQEAIALIESDIYELNGGEQFAIGSPKQLQVVLFEKLKLPSGKKTKTGYSTDSEVLEALDVQGHKIAEKVIRWRELTKLKTQYADALPLLVSPVDGRIHTSLNQTVAATGRLSSSNPNLQNIPIRTEIGREIRKGFVASPGNVLLAADYSQIELRIFAHITRDPELMRTFAAGEDIHRRTAALVFNTPEDEVTSDQRRRAKTINFAVIYGMGDVRLAAELGVDRSTASEWKKKYFAGYPGVRAYADEVVAFARQNGYVKTLLGRRRYTPDISSRVAQFRTAAEREAINMPVQGASADIIKRAMIDVASALLRRGLGSSMILQVHDELLFDCPPSELNALADLVRSAMEGAYDLVDVPLKVEIKTGPNWSDMAVL